MKTIKYILLFIILFPITYVQASHMVGADLTYKCVPGTNGSKYEVSLVYYRDCAGVPTCTGTCSTLGSCTKQVNVRGADPSCAGVLYFSFTVTAVSVRDVNPNPYCTNAKTNCSNMGCTTAGTLTPGIERYEFKGIVDIGPSSGIPSSCCNVSISFEECCRNSSIRNILPDNFYIEATVNRCVGFANPNNCSGPALTNDPYAIMCTSQGFVYNFGAYDEDLDSLIYSLTPALSGYGVSATYIAPYTYDVALPYLAPLAGNYPAGIHLDPVTGDFMITPQSAGWTGVLAMLIEQWRLVNGVYTKVGVTRRDIQIYMKFCTTNKPPNLVTVPAGIPAIKPKTKFDAYVGINFCFDVIAKDSDFSPPSLSDTTYLSWNNVLQSSGATFTPNYLASSRSTLGPREDSYKFCWTPAPSSLKNGIPTIYPFIVKAIDSKCPYPGIVNLGFSIKVNPGIIPLVINKTNNCGTFRLTHSTPTQTYSTKRWLISKTNGIFDSLNMVTSDSPIVDVRFNAPGKYPVRLFVALQNSTLSTTYYDTIVVTKVLTINNDTGFCTYPQNILFKAVNVDTSFKILRWYASPDTSTILDTTNQFSYLIAKPTKMILRAYDSIGASCYYTDTAIVSIANLKSSIRTNTSLQQCLNTNNFVFINESKDSFSNKYSFKWSYSNGDTALVKDTINKKFTNQGAVTLKLKVSNAFGCNDSSSININVWNNPKAIFSVISDTIQCLKGNQFSFVNSSLPGIDSTNHAWLTNGNLFANTKDASLSFSEFGNYSIRLVVTNTKNCKDSISKLVTVNQSPIAGFTTNNVTQCLKTNNFIFTDTSIIPSALLSRTWLVNNTNSGNAIYNYKFPAIGTYPVTLIVKTIKNCPDTATMMVNVLSSPNIGFVINKDIQCFKSNAFIFNDTSNSTGGTLTSKWNFGESINDTSTLTTYSKSYSAANSYVVKLISESNSGCKDSLSKTVIVRPSPTIGFAVNDSTQCLATNKFTCLDTSSISSGIISRLWSTTNFSSSISTINVSFPSDGVYPLKLVVKSNFNCVDSISRDLTVLTSPIVGFTINRDSQCLNTNQFVFTDTSHVVNGVISHIWNFGESLYDTSTSNVGAKKYTSPNGYTIRLYAASNSGCFDSALKVVTVIPSPIAGSIIGPLNNLYINTPYNYKINKQLNHTYNWLVNNGSIINGQGTDSVTVQWTATGSGSLTAVIYNANNCSDTSKLTIGVGVNLQPIISSFTPTSGKTGDTISIFGSNFIGTDTVTFGGTRAQSFSVLSSSVVKAIVGSGTTGSVAITTPIGNTSLTGFTYIPTNAINEVVKLGRLYFYPNPAHSEIIFTNTQIDGAEITVMDVLGREVHRSNLSNNKLKVAELEIGTYFISLIKGDMHYHAKFVKE